MPSDTHQDSKGSHGGAAGGRGYLLQAMVCLLDSLDNSDWMTVALEPFDADHRVDLRWTYESRKPRLAQVKSRDGRPFGVPEIFRLLEQLTATGEASQYHLFLVGALTADALDLTNASTPPDFAPMAVKDRWSSMRIEGVQFSLDHIEQRAPTLIESFLRRQRSPVPDLATRVRGFKALTTTLLEKGHFGREPIAREEFADIVETSLANDVEAGEELPYAELALPPQPFHYLTAYGPEHAGVYFGRSKETARVCGLLTAGKHVPGVILLYGQTGIGKTSLLEAGVFPRLADRFTVIRRRCERGVIPGLQTIMPEGWKALEDANGKPVLVILDQAERVFQNNPTRELELELEGLRNFIRATFEEAASRPRGRLLISFRKEWLAEWTSFLEHGLFLPVFIQRLDDRGLRSVITGLTRTSRLRERYSFSVEVGVADRIVDDLLADPESPLSPTLQILLSRAWERARQLSPSAPVLSLELYGELRRSGYYLPDFLGQQLDAIRNAHAAEVDSGIVLDVLDLHVQSGVTIARSRAFLHRCYPHVLPSKIDALVEALLEAHLLAELGGEVPASKSTRLAHDTLASVVMRRVDSSDLPGQRARRVLLNRLPEWRATRAPLDSADLRVFSLGQSATRATTEDEAALLAASHREMARKQSLERRRRARFGAIVGAAAVAGGVALVQARRADEQSTRSESQRLAAIANSLRQDGDHLRALLAALSAAGSGDTPEAESALRAAITSPLPQCMIRRPKGLCTTPLSADASAIAVTDPEDESVVLIVSSTTGATHARLTGHSGGIWLVRFSPDGRQVATAGGDGTARTWDVETGACLQVLSGHVGIVRFVAFSRDGSHLVTAGGDGTVRIWDATTGGQLATMSVGSETLRVEFDGSGERILCVAMGEGNFASVWDWRQGKRLLEVPCQQVGSTEITNCGFSPDGTTVVVPEGVTAGVWVCAAATHSLTLVGHQDSVLTAAYSPDGRRILTTSSDGTAKLWDATSGVEVLTLGGHGDAISVSAFSRDGRMVVTGSADHTARVWTADDGRCVATLAGMGSPIGFVDCSTDAGTVVTATHWGSVWSWRMGRTDLEARKQISAPKKARGAAFRPGSDDAIANTGSAVVIWNPGTGQTREAFQTDKGILSFDVSPDGSEVVLVGGDGSVGLGSLDAGIVTPLAVNSPVPSQFWSCGFSPEGSHVVLGETTGSCVS